ncbi:hypothetical protein YC2023_034442 [Brassica napus]
MANIQRTQVLVVIIISLLSRISLLQAETIASDVHSNISTLKSIVRITNRLGDGSTLNLHCKSPDDNLGLKILAPNKSWSFTFRPNIWGTAKECFIIVWENKKLKYKIRNISIKYNHLDHFNLETFTSNFEEKHVWQCVKP